MDGLTDIDFACLIEDQTTDLSLPLDTGQSQGGVNSLSQGQSHPRDHSGPGPPQGDPEPFPDHNDPQYDHPGNLGDPNNCQTNTRSPFLHKFHKTACFLLFLLFRPFLTSIHNATDPREIF